MATLFQFPVRTVAEVSLKAIVRNAVTMRSLSGQEVIPVIKADAYGHGMIPVAKSLVGRASCLTLAVATLEEAIELRKKFSPSVTILVLSGFLPHQLDAYIKYHLIPVIHTLSHLKYFMGRRVPEIHLKIDTGMNRLGIPLDQVEETVRLLERLKIKLAGIASHFAESENLVSPFSAEQLQKFESAVFQFREKRLLHTDAKIHIANSAGVLRGRLGFPNAVRVGLALYGVSPNPRMAGSDRLVPALSWKTRVLCIKEIRRGETVGYNRTYMAKKREKIALIPIGYADGLKRLIAENGEVLILGKRCAIRGRISMDLTAVDCTHVSGMREGSLVTIIGENHKETITAWDLANWAMTIPYEVLCGISPRVPRVYLD